MRTLVGVRAVGGGGCLALARDGILLVKATLADGGASNIGTENGKFLALLLVAIFKCVTNKRWHGKGRPGAPGDGFRFPVSINKTFNRTV